MSKIDERYKEACIICEEKKERGIHIFSEFICWECEQNIVHTETDENKYRYYVDKLQKISQSKLYS
ncbi:sigma factor G inhibitor Gin [Bacillus solimangrovi]|uniref:Inhibitor of sigma-G Gin n=1 Tax=Bacillus solimangrovi TaxID=1305675 RepID=A0A1E5LC94_9BACI|nr:sigma factor G inhibitor Gin [Bacillus solimangrovi]OEH91693.1 hypothetical protein BFG57_18040 [Bacillus solimangrovi]